MNGPESTSSKILQKFFWTGDLYIRGILGGILGELENRLDGSLFADELDKKPKGDN